MLTVPKVVQATAEIKKCQRDCVGGAVAADTADI